MRVVNLWGSSLSPVKLKFPRVVQSFFRVLQRIGPRSTETFFSFLGRHCGEEICQIKVGRSHMSDIWMAKQWGQEADVEAAKLDWKVKAQSWLRQKRTLDAPSASSRPAKIRKKSALW